jgi:hypothetical protein
VVRAHGGELLARGSLSSVQRRAIAAIEDCRTAALGGHVEACDRCGASRAVYHSCRNRHCPKCQALAKERWVEARCAQLLPVAYFHVVFTLPHELNDIARAHPRVLLGLLFRCAWATLCELGRDPRHLGGDLGATAVLHTWSQTLAHHIHLHCLVTAGAAADGGARWIPARHGFLFPVRALSRVFRGRFLAELDDACNVGRLPPQVMTRRLRRELRRHEWVVYCKAPFAGPDHLVRYLGRYTHRIAISNDRIVSLEEGVVGFTWRDRAHGDRQRLMRLPALELLRRYLLHVLPDGFQRIRHYGLHANRKDAAVLERCRAVLGAVPAEPRAAETPHEAVLRLMGIDLELCPACGEGRLHVVQHLAPSRLASRLPPHDTS